MERGITMENTISAIVKGEYQYPNMAKPKQFEQTIKFEMCPPNPNEPHYGTGYYMLVVFPDNNEHVIDVRYAKTTDVKTLAESFIKDYWGKNLREYKFI